MLRFTPGVVVLSNQKHKASEVSLADSSGWRTANPAVVTQLESKLPQQWGKTNFRNSRLMCAENGDLHRDSEGRIICSDGKSCATAMQNLELKLAEVDKVQAGCSDACAKALDEGYMFDYVYYMDYKDGSRSLSCIAEMTSSHDEDSNELRTVAPQDKVGLVLDLKKALPALDAVTKYLVQAMGAGKRRAIGRWINASLHLTEPVMALMDRRVAEMGFSHGLRENIFLDSVYIAPPPAKVQFKLPDDFMYACVQQYFSVLDAGGSMGATQFESKFGQRMKYMSLWLSNQEKKHQIPSDHTAWNQLRQDFLTNHATRRIVGQAIEDKKKLEDVLPDCQFLLASFEKKPKVVELDVKKCATEDGDKSKDTEDESLMGTMGVDFDEGIDVQKEPTFSMDPAERVAIMKTNLLMSNAKWFEEEAELKTELAVWATKYPNASLAVLVDSGFSARQVFTKSIQMVKRLLPGGQTIRLGVLPGPSLQATGLAEMEANEQFPTLGCSTTKFATSENAKRLQSGQKKGRREHYNVNEWFLLAKRIDNDLENFEVPFGFSTSLTRCES